MGGGERSETNMLYLLYENVILSQFSLRVSVVDSLESTIIMPVLCGLDVSMSWSDRYKIFRRDASEYFE